MSPNKQLIEKFYGSFAQGDYKGMEECYHPDVRFSDVAFDLQGIKEVGAMWHMLCDRKLPIKVILHSSQANENSGSANWEAHYKFPDKSDGKDIENKIKATFKFQDGKIIDHRDDCDVWALTKQVFGTAGKILGWTPFAPIPIQLALRSKLKKFITRHPQYQ